ncbi:hypothetical protein GUITHDRAFT_133215 [Guillardia theta CCMP2712]|uniref:Uncharacterized protein n=1 Tax=Guillardia theta (strain CCMP2712) TaxID=905079 RepID=L1JYV3_GUITC|nr:hypothetical protein GUITHDRAFT_133215 [Guillardia theta CCMP2712]EKX53519.1 hypothetical protein GUITHDRAFT_133215 [Guillardia theta CCMP2712]|eukprot:XP_005840499.1 hypothetical protein GUITHDRAFT_133215 [Guillardia theta CCMP2712]
MATDSIVGPVEGCGPRSGPRYYFMSGDEALKLGSGEMAGGEGKKFMEKMMEKSRRHAAPEASDIERLLDEMQRIEEPESSDAETQSSRHVNRNDDVDSERMMKQDFIERRKQVTPEKVRNSRQLRQQHQHLLSGTEGSDKKSEILSGKILALRSKRYELMQALAQSHAHETLHPNQDDAMPVLSDEQAMAGASEASSVKSSPAKDVPTERQLELADMEHNSMLSFQFGKDLLIHQDMTDTFGKSGQGCEEQSCIFLEKSINDHLLLMRPQDFINGRLSETLLNEPDQTWSSVRGCLQLLEEAMESLASIQGGRLLQDSQEIRGVREVSASDDDFDTSNASTMCTESARGSISLHPGALNSCIRSWTPHSSYEASTFDAEWDMAGGADHRILDDMEESADDEDEDEDEGDFGHKVEPEDDDMPKSFLCSAAVVTASADRFCSDTASDVSSSEIEWEESEIDDLEADQEMGTQARDCTCDIQQSMTECRPLLATFETINASANNQRTMLSNTDRQVSRKCPDGTNDLNLNETFLGLGDGKSEAFSAMCDLIDNLRKDVEEIQKHANAICNLSNSMTDDAARPGSSSIDPLKRGPQSLGSRNPLMDIQPEVFHSSNSGSTKDERSETGMNCEKLRTDSRCSREFLTQNGIFQGLKERDFVDQLREQRIALAKILMYKRETDQLRDVERKLFWIQNKLSLDTVGTSPSAYETFTQVLEVREELDFALNESLEASPKIRAEATVPKCQDQSLQADDRADEDEENIISPEQAEKIVWQCLGHSESSYCDREAQYHIERTEKLCQTEWYEPSCGAREKSLLEQQCQEWAMEKIAIFLNEVKLSRRSVDNLMKEIAFNGQQELKIDQVLINSKQMGNDLSKIEANLMKLVINQNHLQDSMEEANIRLGDAGIKLEKDSTILSRLADKEERLVSLYTAIERQLEKFRNNGRDSVIELQERLETKVRQAQQVTDGMTSFLKETAAMKNWISNSPEARSGQTFTVNCREAVELPDMSRFSAVEPASEDSSKLIDYVRMKSRESKRFGSCPDEVELDLSSFPLGPGI